MQIKVEPVGELKFAVRKNSVAVPSCLCPNCIGLGYIETMDDSLECNLCKGSGRSS